MNAYAVIEIFGRAFFCVVRSGVMLVNVFASFCFAYDVSSIGGYRVGRFSCPRFPHSILKPDPIPRGCFTANKRFFAPSMAFWASMGVYGAKIKGVDEGY